MAALSRRRLLRLGLAAGAAPLFGRAAFAAAPSDTPLHGLSAFGDLKYPPGFAHFDYVEADAPKGGQMNFSPPNWYFNQSVDTFNTLNSYTRKGDAPPRMELCFDSLMKSALDEPDSVYGLLAETVTISPDRNGFTFALRPQARFHDGTTLTAEDVASSMMLLKSDGHPQIYLSMRELTEAVALDAATVRLTFDGRQSDRTILDIVGFPIFSKAYYEANPFTASRMDPPLGSGPYRVGRVAAGQSITYERAQDYWARDLPVNRGEYNFDRIRIDVFRDRQAAFEAFKKGDTHYRQEFTSRTWATGYDFPAIASGKVIKREFPSELRPSMQASAINTRRPQFRDARVREAIGLCFDFEWTRQALFFGAYERSQSCFERSPYKAEGLPSPEERAIMEPLRDALPEAAFGEAILQPVSNGSGRDRKLLGEAGRLLAEAGWKRGAGSGDQRFLVDADGKRLTLEILVNDDAFVRIDSPWVENMRLVGIDASIRLVDQTQFQARQVEFDFDMVSMALSFTASPTRDELVNLFHSSAAAIPGTRNYPGTADPAVDALVEKAGAARDREALTVAMRALDRVLRARRDWIPNWNAANHRVAYWDMFGFKEPKPDYGFPVETLWWFDKDRAAAIGKA